MKRILPLILTVLLIPGMLAVPARADEVTESGWIELLDYYFMDNGSSNATIMKNGDYFTYYTNRIATKRTEITFTSTQPVSSVAFGVYFLPERYEATVVNLGNGLYKAYVEADLNFESIQVYPTFANSYDVLVNVLSFKVSTVSSIYRVLPADSYGVMTGDGNFTLSYSGQYVNHFWDTTGVGYDSRSYQINTVISGNVHAYDFVDVILALRTSDIASVSVTDTSNPLPYEINDIFEFSTDQEALATPVTFVSLRIDVRELETGYYPQIVISGVSLPTYNMFAISSVCGVLVIDPPSDLAHWFTQVGFWFADQTNALGTGLANIYNSINSGITNVGNWIGDQTNALGTGLANIYNSIGTWGQNIIASIDALPDRIAEALQALVVPSDTALQDFGESSQQIAQDRFGGVYEGAMIVDSFAGQLQAQAATLILTVPVVNLNILGTLFPLGGWEVDLVPDGSEVIIEAVKLMIDILATLAFINGIKSRLERTLEQ